MKVIWSRVAREEVHDIWLFLADRNPDYADRVETRIVERTRDLETLPHLGRPVRGTERRLLSITDVQYVVEYEIEPGDETVRILSVWSPRQNRDEP